MKLFISSKSLHVALNFWVWFFFFFSVKGRGFVSEPDYLVTSLSGTWEPEVIHGRENVKVREYLNEMQLD